mmetsp:Transcript_37482/g.74351  ORF Transcript_37482/g.74351 Transcript_37482/m.74351 type:complete len:665 (-) Transcript_37482:15-2009(-)|eukprot:CAMPEP_0172670270 /NCGR_PEP_ID=MMETSP1074-20121228/10196_1 /TAXON_ID=2916 /ORGANISM="Ceratium fusus, Strain PA161109" /LENGTH=664 /DNA_ID=CAMNT_0013487153 /DNA_START=28 /DNA_END=2022 /DNA_ORIENTATION=+
MTMMAPVGTYLAEQVTNSCFDLVSFPYYEQQRRANMRQAGLGTLASCSRPSSSRCRRRHGPDITKCAVLPTIPIDPLLDKEASDPGDVSQHAKSAQRHREERRIHHDLRVHRSAARLCRGEHGATTPSDEDVVRQLTQPLDHVSTRPCTSDEISTRLHTTDRVIRTAPEGGQTLQRRLTRCHDSYEDLFSEGLAGTELEQLPARLNRPLSLALLRGRRRPRGRDWGIAAAEAAAAAAAAAISVLPEDPVQAYFNKEKAAREERSKRKQSAGLLKSAVYREGGVLDALRSAPQELESTTDLPDSAEVLRAPPTKSTPSSDIGNQDVPWLPKQKVHPTKREACQLLRLFILGEPPALLVSAGAALAGTMRQSPSTKQQGGAEKQISPRAREKALYETCGTRDQVRQLHAFWDRLDMDSTGSLEQGEFRRALERMLTEPFPLQQKDRRLSATETKNTAGNRKEEWQQPDALAAFISSPEDATRQALKLCDKISLAHASGRKSFTIDVEGLMRLIWPCADLQELRTMKAWYDDIALRNSRWCVPAPEVCPLRKMEELMAVFRYLDKNGSGIICVEELISQGLLHRETQKKHLEASMELDVGAFCALLCPTGYRADSRAETGTTKEGERVLLDRRLGCWRFEEVGRKISLISSGRVSPDAAAGPESEPV